jgi:hypothetical protein
VVAPTLSLLVLSEDGSSHAHRTVVALTTRMLRLVDPHAQTHRIHFEPAEDSLRLGVRANLWKSWRGPNRRDQRAIRNLCRKLAAKILEEDVSTFVLFHVDGDRPWCERDTSENVVQFKAFVQSLRPLVEKNLRDRGLLTDKDDAQALVAERLGRICPVTPYYSIEAWLYQNTARARELCQQGCGKHVAVIDQWERDRASLDEIRKPKLGCAKIHNDLLAESFTAALADILYALGKSFHHTVKRLQSCPGIAQALRATWDPGAIQA